MKKSRWFIVILWVLVLLFSSFQLVFAEEITTPIATPEDCTNCVWIADEIYATGGYWLDLGSQNNEDPNIKENGIMPMSDVAPTGLIKIGYQGETYFTRAVSTGINIYSKIGDAPKVTFTEGSAGSTKYHVLEVEPDENNFIQVDYAGDTPKYMNNFYDSNLTNNGYWLVGGINAGFFNNTSSSGEYGYPTGAVMVNNEWQMYKAFQTTPAYGRGFATAYIKGSNLDLLYNGWYNGEWHGVGYADGAYSLTTDYDFAVSGAYTLLKDGVAIDITNGDNGSTNYRVYGRSVTLFGQKADGTYVLVTTEGALGSSASDYVAAQTSLMQELGCVDAIRFDGGGSTQMMYDGGLVNQENITPTSTPTATPESTPTSTPETTFAVEIYDEVNKVDIFNGNLKLGAIVQILNPDNSLANEYQITQTQKIDLTATSTDTSQFKNWNVEVKDNGNLVLCTPIYEEVVTPTPTATPTPTPEVTATPSATPSSTPETTNTPSATPTNTPEVTETPSATPTSTPDVTETPTSTPTSTPEVTNTPSSTPTATPTATPTSTPTVVPTVTPSATPSIIPVITPTSTSSIVPVITPSATPETTVVPVVDHSNDEFVITFLGCNGKTVRVVKVKYGENAMAPENYYGLTWDSYYNVTENRDIRPNNCKVATNTYRPVNTGDTTSALPYACVAGIGLLFLGIVLFLNKKKDTETPENFSNNKLRPQ